MAYLYLYESVAVNAQLQLLDSFQIFHPLHPNISLNVVVVILNVLKVTKLFNDPLGLAGKGITTTMKS